VSSYRFATIALAAAALLPAQDVTEVPDTIRPGVLAVETDFRSQPLMRYGITSRLEFRIESGLGAKLMLFGEAGLRPAVSITATTFDREVSLAWFKTLPRGVWMAGSAAWGTQAFVFGRDMGRGFGAYSEVFRDPDGWGADLGVTRTLGRKSAVEAGFGRTRADGWFSMIKLTREFSIWSREKPE
jgi:hypothetical protein